MNKQISVDKKIIGAIGAFLFVSPDLNLIESILIYCGAEYHDRVRLIAVAVFLVLDVVLGVLFLKSKPNKKTIASFVIFNIIYLMPLLIDKDIMAIMQYLVLIVPVTIIALMLSTDDDIKHIYLKYLVYASRILMLVAILYVVLQYTSTYRDEKGVVIIYNMTYGDMAYLFLTGFVVSAIDCIERKHIISYIGLIIFSLTIFFSGSRSAILCVIFTIILWVTLIIIKAPKGGKIKSLVAIIAIVATATAGMFFIPEGSRLNFIHFDVTSPDFSIKNLIFETNEENGNDINVIYVPQNSEMNIYDIYEYEIIKRDNSKSVTENILHDDVASGRNEIIQLVNEDDRSIAENYKVKNHRTFLWNAAINEFKRHPITGNGPRYFMKKYDGFYPHNILLEAMTDFGIVGLIVEVALGLYCFVKGIKLYLKDDKNYYFGLILLLFSHVPRYLLYTTIYSNPTIALTVLFFFTVGNLDVGKEDESLSDDII